MTTPQVSSRVDRYLKRADLPGQIRPQSERREALRLLMSEDQNDAEALFDFRFLASSEERADLSASARRLVTLEHLLGDRDQARLALTALEAEEVTPLLETAFTRSLEMVGEMELGLEMLTLLRENEAVGERLLTTLEQVAQICDGENVAALTAAWLAHPPTSVALAAACRLADQVRQPGWEPDGGWGPVSSDHHTAWSSESLKRTSHSSLRSEPLSLEGLTGCQLHLRERHLGDSRLEVRVHRPRETSVLLGKIEDEAGLWKSHSFSLKPFSDQTIELGIYHRGYEGQSQLDDVLVTGFLTDVTRPLSVVAGDWLPVETPSGPGWSDSPDADLPHNAEVSLTTAPLSLEGLSGSALSFRTQFSLERNHDLCHVEIRSVGGGWQELEAISGVEEWGERLVDLSDYDGQEVELRFRVTTDNNRASPGMEVANLTVTGSSTTAPQVLIPLDGFAQDREQENALVQFLLEPAPHQREHAYQALAHLAAATKELKAALTCWPVLRESLDAPDLDQRIDALARLWPHHREATLELQKLLVEDRQPGDDLRDLAELLLSAGPEGYDLLRRRLQAGATDAATRNANLRFYARLAQFGSAEQAQIAFRTATAAVSNESLEGQRNLFLELVEAHQGELEISSDAWRGLTSWMAPGEGLGDALAAYQALLSLVEPEAAVQAVEFVRKHQAQGALADSSLGECVQRMSADLLSYPEQLESALYGLLNRSSQADLSLDDEGLLIGGSWIEIEA